MLCKWPRRRGDKVSVRDILLGGVSKVRNKEKDQSIDGSLVKDGNELLNIFGDQTITHL